MGAPVIFVKFVRGPRGVALAAGLALGLVVVPDLSAQAQQVQAGPAAALSAANSQVQVQEQTPDNYVYGYTPEFSSLPATMPTQMTAAQAQAVEQFNANCGGDTRCPFDGRITPVHLRGNVWMLVGEPGQSNVVVQAGDEGMLVVDTGVEAMAPELLAAIEEVAAQASHNHTAIHWIIDTDSAADHIGGNAVLGGSGSRYGREFMYEAPGLTPGAIVLGDQNLLTQLIAPPNGQSPVAEPMWPTETHNEPVYSWYFNNEAVVMAHPPVANTNGNEMVMFRQSDVLATGDVLDLDTYPIIDTAKGGTIDGELTTLNQVLEMAVSASMTDEDTTRPGTLVIPGHGRLAVQYDVQHYINVVTRIRNRIMYYKDQGKTLEQVLALRPSWDYDGRWGGTQGPWTTKDFVEAVYNTLPRRGPAVFSIPNTPASGG